MLTSALGFLGGTPGAHHPDFLTRPSLLTLTQGGHPASFRYPGGLLLYSNAVVCHIVFKASVLFGRADPEIDILSFYLDDRSLAYTLGHLITLFFSVAGVVLTYLVSYRLIRDRAFSFVAALYLSTSILWVADTHFVTVDVPLAALTLATVWLSLRFTAGGVAPTAAQAAVLGVGVGLAASVKYPGALAAIPVMAATWPCHRGRRRWWLGSALAGLAAVAAFLVTNPFIVIEPERFRSDLLAEVRHARTGHFGYSVDGPWLFHLTDTLFHALGLPVLILALAGLAWLVATASVGWRSKLVTLTFPLAFYAVVGSSQLGFQRYMLPVLPFVAVLAGLGAHAVFERLRRRRLLVVGLAAAAALFNAADALRHDRLLLEEDTRSTLDRILAEAKLDPRTVVYAGPYVRRAFLPYTLLESSAELEDVEADLLTLDSFSHDRWIYTSRPGRTSDRDTMLRRLEEQGIRRSLRVAISPYAVPKAEVPFCPKSLYSPYPPDLGFRRAPGPYIEIYGRDHRLVGRIDRACQALGLRCERSGASRGYYYDELKEHP